MKNELAGGRPEGEKSGADIRGWMVAVKMGRTGCVYEMLGAESTGFQGGRVRGKLECQAQAIG